MNDISIIFEDQAFLAIDKPSGITVNRSENEKGETIQDWSEKKIGIKYQVSGIKDKSDFVNRGGIVHRLDKETSGILLIAKNEDIFSKLQAQFLARKVEKTYNALIHGKLDWRRQLIKAKVGRLPWNRRKFGVIPDGRDAETEIEKIQQFTQLNKKIYTLINAYPRTGRTHQIRIHLKYINHPIVADFLYAGRKVYREDIKICPRLFLHAAKVRFYHPENNNQIEIESKLPDDLLKTLNQFDKI